MQMMIKTILNNMVNVVRCNGRNLVSSGQLRDSSKAEEKLSTTHQFLFGTVGLEALGKDVSILHQHFPNSLQRQDVSTVTHPLSWQENPRQ